MNLLLRRRLPSSLSSTSYLQNCCFLCHEVCSSSRNPFSTSPRFYSGGPVLTNSRRQTDHRQKQQQQQQRQAVFHSQEFFNRNFLSSHRFKSSQRSSGGSSSSFFNDNLFATVSVGLLLVGCYAFRWYINLEPDYSLPKKTKKQENLEHSRPLPEENPVSDDALSEKSEKHPTIESNTIATPPVVSATTTTTDSEEQLSKTNEDNKVDVETVAMDTEFHDEVPEALVYVKPEDKAFPTHVPYIIVGAGAAGMSAARSIRASDPTSRVLLIAGGASGSGRTSEPGIEETAYVEPPPYLRPPLSKELWNRTSSKEKKLLRSDGDIRRHSWLYYEPDSFFLKPEDLSAVQYGGVALVRGDPVVRLDPDRHIVFLASGRQITYDRCLLATGGTPKRLKELEVCSRTGVDLTGTGHVSYFRNMADYRRLRDLADKLRETGGRIAVIGGGFLGSELSVSLLKQPPKSTDASTTTPLTTMAKDSPDPMQSKLSVIHAFRETVPMSSVLPPCLASAVGRFESSKGVELWSSSDVVGLSLVPENKTHTTTTTTQATVKEQAKFVPMGTVAASTSSSERVRLRVRRSVSGIERVEEVDVDHVVCVIGIDPNTDLSSEAGLEVDPNNGGFLVNAELEARQGVYVAGDAASYWDPIVGCRRRVEHLNFAEEAGSLAGKNMAASLLTSGTACRTASSSHYQHQSSLWSTLGPELSWDAVGLIDSRLLLTRGFFASTNDDNNNNDTSTDKTTSTPRPISSLVPDANLGRLTKGVVFYLTPKEKRLVGILLWNMPDEVYSDKDYPGPSRLNLARSILAERHIIGGGNGNDNDKEKEKNDLCELASRFDIYGEIAEEYAQLQEYIKRKGLDMAKVNENDNNNNNDNNNKGESVDNKDSDISQP